MGRHRAFDLEEAVAKATKLFWHGYEATSLTDLTEALGISPASFYFAFGSKEALFRQVVDRYVAARDEAVAGAFQDRSARDGVAALLRSYVEVLTDPAHTPGCLLVNNALTAGGGEVLQRWLSDHRKTFRTMLEARFAAEPAVVDPAMIARFVTMIAGGLAVEAKHGASRETLDAMIELAMGCIDQRLQGAGAQ
jgi:AcrR family transcriptional regulator